MATSILSGCSGFNRPGEAGPGDFFGPVYSPDGERVAFRKMINRLENDLWIGDLEYSYDEKDIVRERLLFDTTFKVVSIAWSPDSSQVAFIDATSADTPDAPSTDRLLIVDIKTGGYRVVASEDGSVITRISFIFGWTGDRITFAANVGDARRNFEIMSDGSGLRQIAP
jgi:dipeptidyl aminopeptidase/acylaminoacyl peptidase